MVKVLRKNLIKAAPSLHHEHDSYKWWVLMTVMIGTFMAVLDSTIVNVALPKMMASFGTDIDKIEWVLTSYLLIFAVMLPSSGWIADHLGYKKTYAFGLTLFTIGSALCSLAWNENALIFFRVVQGAGAGLIMPVGMAIVTRVFPPNQRGTALGFWGIASSASVSLGPLFGGYLVDTFSWQTIFDVNVPVGIIGVMAVLIVQQEIKAESSRKFDIVGFLSMTVFLTSLLLALSDGNANWNTGGWSSNFILSCFAISIISFVIFIITELHVEHPIIELKLFYDRNFALANIILFLFGLSFFGNAFLLPLYLQNSLGYTALQAGLVFFPVGILQAFVSPIAGRLTDKINPKIPVLIGISLLALSMYMFSFFSLETEKGQVMLPLYIRGLSLGLIFIPLSAIALLDIPKVKMAQASGLFNTIRQIGGSFGVAILGALLSQRQIFHSQIYSQSVSSDSPAFQHTFNGVKNFVAHSVGGSAAEISARAKALIAQNIFGQAFVQGINDDFFAGAVITVLILIPIFFLKIKKSKKHKKIEIME
jgi:DHA2 family multidrug resistance protein